MYDNEATHLSKKQLTRLKLNPHNTLRRSDSAFLCAHCQALVLPDVLFSGVQNRNHCPICLWSRHLDLFQAGDRLAVCKAPMQPVGLTTKQIRKKYGMQSGELMLIHHCTGCGRISLNRIAADDDPERILEAFEASTSLTAALLASLESAQVRLLDQQDAELVQRQLFGQKV